MKFLSQAQIASHFGPIQANSDQSTITFDMALSNKHSVTIGASRTLAVQNDQDGQAFMLFITQGGAGSFTVTWWSGIKWPNNTAPTLTTTSGKIDVFSFVKTGSGAYLGFVVGQNL